MSNVKVAVRVRPINKRELDQNGKTIVETNGDTVSVTNLKVDISEYGDSRERVKSFTFDYCYDSTGDQRSPGYAPQQQPGPTSSTIVFQDLGTEILQAAFEGYNACVLAYGQTSTGKTYTMSGVQEDPGLIPRICEGLFSHVDDFEATDVSFRVHISYLEIYNERVRDLLRPSLSRKNEKYTLKVREHPKDGPYVQDLSSHVVKDNEQIQTLLEKGNENRTTASTYMHDLSSRSHAIVTINFVQAKLEDDLPHEIVSKIHLVDLAGSERADPNWSHNYRGRLKEGSNINKSLVTLGNVIKTLAEKSILSWSTDSLGSTQSFASSAGGEGRASPFCSPKRVRIPYIPYRDSVLTWLLKDSLGGNSKTIMIATISPANICYNETISTLRYAQRAKNIVNKPKINEDASVTLIRELRQEIDRLKQLLAGTQMEFYPHGDVMYVVPFQKSQAQGEPLVSLPDSSNILQKELQLQEDRADQLTQTWMGKWMETHEIIKESDLSIRGLSKSSSMGVLIDSQMPHLIGMDNDILSTGVIIYHLKEGKTLVGKEDAKREQDIVLSGPGIQREHCYIKNVNGSVTLHPNRGSQCTVNGLDCKGPTLLKQGDSVILGKTQIFRFNNPEEAAALRERRESQESILDESDEYCSDSDYSQQRGVQTNRLQSLQLENQYQTETEKIERAKEELERLKQEHLRAEEQRQLKEEELWKTHDRHLHEIEEEKKRLTKLKEETFIQRHKAEQELLYAKECLEKERDAFYKELQAELSKITSSSNKGVQGHSVLQEDINSNEEIIEIINRRKQSIEGQLKTIAQKEIIKTLSHRETERTLRKKTDDLEDEFENSKHQIENQLGKIREIEEQYHQTDAKKYSEINKTEEELDELQQREEQLELYIEEKEDLLMVKSDKPRPLRTACSAEILTKLENETEFSQRTSSMLALNRGSVGDLPAISHQFSLSSMMSVDSQSMDSNIDEINSDNGSKSKYKKISADAKTVTDRLYQKSTPKFKYEPKRKKDLSPGGNSKMTKGLKSSPVSPDSVNSPSQTRLPSDIKRQKYGHVENTPPSRSSESQSLLRNSLTKRQIKSSVSLASVPEAIGEEGDDTIMHSTPDISQVVRRRKGVQRRTLDDEFRRHSEPLGEELADAFEKYSQEMEKSGGDNSYYRHSKSEDETMNCDNLNIPIVIVSDCKNENENIKTFQNNGTVTSQGQESRVTKAEESLCTSMDNGCPLQCHVSMAGGVGGKECQVYNTNNVYNDTGADSGMCTSANFTVDLMPILNVSYSQGESPVPYLSSYDNECVVSNLTESRGENVKQNLVCNSETSTGQNSEEMIRVRNKRDLKPHPGTSDVPTKIRKGDKNNYEWLVNAITNLNEEKLLISGEEPVEQTVDNSFISNEENHVCSTEHSHDMRHDNKGRQLTLDNVKHGQTLEPNHHTNISTEQGYFDQEENNTYYSDSLEDEDSLDGSRPVRYHEDMSESGGDNNESSHEENTDENDNGVMDYFSDVDPDLIDGEEMEQELSDYDDAERAEIFLQYPSDFPGSLLYSIKEESVPASPDISESRDISSEISSVGDQTLEGIDDNYISQVVILGQEDQAVIRKSDTKVEDTTDIDMKSILSASHSEQDNKLHKALEPKTQISDSLQNSNVRSEKDVILSAEMEEIEESPIVYHHIGTVKSNNVNQDDSHLTFTMNSGGRSGLNVESEFSSNIDHEDSVKSRNELDFITRNTEENSGLPRTNLQTAEKCLSGVKSNKTGTEISDTSNQDSDSFLDQSGQTNMKGLDKNIDKTETCDEQHVIETEQTGISVTSEEITPGDIPQYLSNVAQSIRQALVADTDTDSFSDSSNQQTFDELRTKPMIGKNPEKETDSKLGPMIREISNADKTSLSKRLDTYSETVQRVDVSSSVDSSETSVVHEKDKTNDSELTQISVTDSNVTKSQELSEMLESNVTAEGDKTPGKSGLEKNVAYNKVSRQKKVRPETRTLGVSTGPDLVSVSCGEGSDDSLQEVQEELQVLQEALDNKSPKTSGTNGNSISSARKATRKRAMQKRGSGICTESEDLMSDDSPGSQGKSSRPDSASRRRRRPNAKSNERPGKKSKELSSDEYITSDDDSIYTDESPSRVNEENQEEIPIDIAKTLNECIDELTESISQNVELENNDMDRNIPNGYYKEGDEQKLNDERHKRNVNGNYIPSLQLSSPRDSNDQSIEDYGNDSQQMSWRSYESSGGHSLRSSSETRDASQQTDFASPPLRSPMSTQTVGVGMHSLSVSPVSVWNSVDKCIKSPKGFSEATKEKSPGGRKIAKKKQCKLSDLSFTTPDTWSADTTGLPDSNNEMESGSESEGEAVVMETETCSPMTPSTSDHFFESGCMVLQEPPTGRNVPVKYEVTIRPEETNVHYNVEKTEYKTYGLNSPNYNSENVTFPESININVTDRTINTTERKQETVTTQRFQLHQNTDDSPSGNIVSERTFQASRKMSTDNSDLPMRSDRSTKDHNEKHFVETTCENNPIESNKLTEKLDYGSSPRESDATSDYGTMIFDRRKGVSAAYDSDDIDSLASYGKYFSESQENTPRDTKRQGDDVVSLSDLNVQNGESNSERSSDSQLSVVSSEDLTPRPVNLPDDEMISHDHSRSSEDIYISAKMSTASSESSDYRTPQQSPRENINDISCEDIEIPNISEIPRNLVHQQILDEMKIQKTVSVNTELLQRENDQSREQIIRETLKNELQKKIDDLKHNGKTKDDSAISSDYTDGDSVTVSPRGSQLYESDKTLRIGNIRPNSVEVRTTKTDTSFEPTTGAQSYLPKLCDIDNKSVQKTPLKDSGNVFDDDDLEEFQSVTSEHMMNAQYQNHDTNEDSMIPKSENRTSKCIENKMFEDNVNSDRSLSPGEIIADDMYEDFASGLNSGGDMNNDEEYHEEKSQNDATENFDDGQKSAELIKMLDSNKQLKNKSPSLSDLQKDKGFEDYRRSVSENCIDQYEENATPNLSTCSSNESIVFVFMGQSHTRESMEQLKHYTSKQKGYKVHESDDNILSQNNADDANMSYKDSDSKGSDGSIDSRAEMMANMESLLSKSTGSQENSEEIGIESQATSYGNYSQDISEGNYSQDISEGNNSQDISEDIGSLEDNLDQTDVFGENSYEEVVEHMYQENVDRTQAGLIHGNVSRRHEEDEEPLRHRFGIDESILPIPTRSISSDNLPRKILSLRTIHRSRSTSLLDIGTIERTNNSSDNEGIFPPNVQHSEHNSSEFIGDEQNVMKEILGLGNNEDENVEISDMPATPAPSMVDDLADNQSSHAINKDVLYSSLVPLQSQLDHNGNVENVVHDRISDNEQTSHTSMSVGIQASLADSETQTDPSLMLTPDGQMIQVLPGLDSPFRAQSMVTLQGRMTQFNPSEDSQNWYNLSSLMLETIPLLKTINERLPGADISLASSTENVIVIEGTTLATQTSLSLEDLNTTAVQTDQDLENKQLDHGVANSTQTEVHELEHSFTETYDMLPDNVHDRIEMSVQTDTPEIKVTEMSDICLQTDFVWSIAGQQPVTTTTDSVFSVQRDTNRQTEDVRTTEVILKPEITSQVYRGISLDENNMVEKSEQEDSSEEQYSDTCVLFYDFVNKCYVQKIIESDSTTINKSKITLDESRDSRTKSSGETNEVIGEQETVSSRTKRSGETNEIISEQDTVSSHTTVNHNDEQFDRTRQIYPHNRDYNYRTMSKQVDTPKHEAKLELSSNSSRNSSAIFSQRTDPRSYSERYMSGEIGLTKTENKYVGHQNEKNDHASKEKSNESSEEEITEEIVTYEIPAEVSETFSSEKQSRSFSQKFMEMQPSERKTTTRKYETEMNNYKPALKLQPDETVHKHFTLANSKTYSEKYMDDETLMNKNAETPDDIVIEEIETFEMPIDMGSLSDLPSEQKPSHLLGDDDSIVEDVVSPRRDDNKESWIRDNIQPTQAGIRQNTNTQTSTSSQQSGSSQSDTSQKTSESGQSEHHSYQSKTVERKKIPNRGDSDSEDENECKDEVFEHISEHHHSKHDNTQVQTILTEREHVMETEFYVPDIEASQAEMDALKEEHNKTMEAIRKAANERKHRTDQLKDKTKKVIETELEMTKEVENWNDEEVERRKNDGRQVTFDMNAVETREYSICSEDKEPQTDDSMTEKTSEEDFIIETRHNKPEIDESEKKLQQLEERWKDYVRKEKELKQQEVDETKTDLIDDVLSDSESHPRQVERPNFNKYKVHTDIQTEEPISPITKVDRADVKFMPTYSLDYRRERPEMNETIVQTNVSNIRSERKSTYPPVDSKSNKTSDKVPAPLESERAPVKSLPRSLSVDNYSKYKGATRSTGVEVSVDSSDDFTQTDDIQLGNEPANRHKDMNSNQIRSELDRLHNERIEIIEMMALNYLPASLTVELLEAKLNYCIGQTDLLLESLEDTWKIQEACNISESETNIVTKEYLKKYREDLRKSKHDIRICKEQMDMKTGKGRGRPVGRKRDLFKLKRQAEIEAFRAERKLAQQNFNTVKSIHRLSPALDDSDRHTRSSSLSSRSSINHHTMTPSELAAYLIKLRKQVVKATEQEELRHRISRSCSPYVGHRNDVDCSPLTSPRSYSAYSSEHLSLPPRISTSNTDSSENRLRSYLTVPSSHPRSYSAEPNYYSSIQQHSYTTERERYSHPVDRSSTYRSPQSPYDSRPSSVDYYRSTSPLDNIGPRRLSLERETYSESIYSDSEPQQLLREIQEARQLNQREITKAEETLKSYNRYGTDLLRPQYSNDVLNTTGTSLSGSYELYDDRSTITMSRSSSCRSLDRDSDSVHSSYLSPRYEHDILHTRPVRSSDIKSRIYTRRRKPLS